VSPSAIDCPFGPGAMMPSQELPRIRDEPEPVTVRESLIFDLVEDLERQLKLLREENVTLRRERDALVKAAKDWRSE